MGISGKAADVVNERAYFNHTIRKVAIGDDIIEEEFLNDLGRVGYGSVLCSESLPASLTS